MLTITIHETLLGLEAETVQLDNRYYVLPFGTMRLANKREEPFRTRSELASYLYGVASLVVDTKTKSVLKSRSF